MTSVIKRFFYWFSVVVIISATVLLYLAWYRNYSYKHPDIIKVEPFSYAQELPVRVWLLWDEGMVNSPSEGIIDYRYPGQIVRVPKGALLGEIRNGNSVTGTIRSGREGYFIPAADGMEGLWTYPFLWNSQGNVDEPQILWYQNGSYITRGQAVGKMIFQPQSLKCVVFADLTPELEKDLKRGWVKIKRSPLDLPMDVRVRVFRHVETHMVQVYMDLPFFPLDIVASRQVSYTLYTGEESGVLIPESSLMVQDGQKGVFRVRGNFTEFTLVEGIPLGEGRFFVSQGLKPGNLVVLNGSKAREGRIKLW